MELRSWQFAVALLLSALLHLALLPLFSFHGATKNEEKPEPKVVVMEFAALGTPEGTEEAPKPAPPPPPPAPPQPEPTPPPPEPQPPEIQPPPEPEPPAVEVPPEPEPPPEVKPEPEPEAAVEVEPPARPLPKPEPPKKPEPPPPTPAPPRPQPPAPPQPQPPQPGPVAPPTAPAPAPGPAGPAVPGPAAPSGPPKTPKGIETGVAGARAQDEMSRYVTTLFTMIDRKKEYPSQSLRRREQGTVSIRLTIARDGKLLDVSSPTGSPARLVEASLQAVRDAAPFPPLPKSLDKDQAVFEVPVTYRLQ